MERERDGEREIERERGERQVIGGGGIAKRMICDA